MANIYDFRQRWKFIFIVTAVLIAIASVVASDTLIRKLAQEERQKMEVWANAMRLLTSPDTTDVASLNMDLILRIIEGNTTIPVLLCNEEGMLESSKNVEIPESQDGIDGFIQQKINKFRDKNPPIVITLEEGQSQYPDYADSTGLKRLSVSTYTR